MLKWAKAQLKKDIQDVKRIEKQREEAVSELEKLNRLLKGITDKMK